MQKKILYIVIALVATISIIYSFTGGQTQEQLEEEIADHRDEIDRFMSNSDDSPFAEKNNYKGLNYYPPKLAYKIKAKFIPVENQEVYTLPTNDGKEKQYLTYGHARFTFDDTDNQLLILENVEENELFLAFGDETSAIETYGAGRYLDLTHNGGGSIIIDFNKAYNPFCAYDESYTCPLPPKENLLTIAIPAGEKTYEQ